MGLVAGSHPAVWMGAVTEGFLEVAVDVRGGLGGGEEGRQGSSEGGDTGLGVGGCEQRGLVGLAEFLVHTAGGGHQN